jgi:hypothetical protein
MFGADRAMFGADKAMFGVKQDDFGGETRLCSERNKGLSQGGDDRGGSKRA